jgi:hypothetical protein
VQRVFPPAKHVFHAAKRVRRVFLEHRQSTLKVCAAEMSSGFDLLAEPLATNAAGRAGPGKAINPPARRFYRRTALRFRTFAEGETRR